MKTNYGTAAVLYVLGFLIGIQAMTTMTVDIGIIGIIGIGTELLILIVTGLFMYHIIELGFIADALFESRKEELVK